MVYNATTQYLGAALNGELSLDEAMAWEEHWQEVIVWAGAMSLVLAVLTVIAVPWVMGCGPRMPFSE